VLLVLAVGALAGLLFARRLGRRVAEAPVRRSRRSAVDPDDRLRRADLERRRDELYEQLQRSDNEEDRRQLEDQAARVLRELDRLSESTGGHAEAVRATAVGSTGAAGSTAPVASRRSGHPMLAGFLGGAAMAGLVGLLIYFAVRDAKPEAGSPAAAPPAASAPASRSEHPAAELSPEAQARLDALRQRVAAEPGDLVARKQLALALLASEQFFEAFQISDEILAERPDDPDGLYVQGMVRMTMGQDDVALAMLDRVLDRYPNHVLALAGRGMILMRGGDRDAAVIAWERALEAAGGSHPDLEQLLAMARDPDHPGLESAPEAASGPAGTSSAQRGPDPAGPAAGVGGAGVAADRYGVRVELAPGLSAPPGAVLFVGLRAAGAGPPAAVKRIEGPVFPLELTLGAADSMMGQALPDQGTLTVRLDADGSASTRDGSDLSTDAAARVGTSVRLVLGG
jgi:tetratricopeptide (TPR) repeat protein